MPRDPKDIDATEKADAPADISKPTPEEVAEAERKRKEAEAAAAAVEAAAAAEAANLKGDDKTEKNEALEHLKDITVLAKNLRDIAKERALAKNEEKGDAKLDRTAVVKEAYTDPCEHLSEAEFLELEKAVNAIAPFLPSLQPKPGRKPTPAVKPQGSAEGDFADPEGTNKGHLSKKEAEAVLSLVNKTVPKILETLSALTEKVS